MGNLPLVIDVANRAKLNGIRDKWNDLPNPSGFIQEILIPALSDTFSTGLLEASTPDAFARAGAFRRAFESYTETGNKFPAGGNIYRSLVGEWRGLIAAIALDSAAFSVREIPLRYSDGKGVEHTANIYEPSGALGNMLGPRKERWTQGIEGENGEKEAVVSLLRYHNVAVGAASPESLVFTASTYNLDSSDFPWTGNTKEGGVRFRDPLEGVLDSPQTLALYAYVGYLIDNLGKFEASFPENIRPDYEGVRHHLEEWRDEIADYARAKGYSLDAAAVLPVALPLGGRYGRLFNYAVKMYGENGEFSENNLSGEEGFDPQDLLLESTAPIAEIKLDTPYSRNTELLRSLPVSLLKARIKGEEDRHAFFALPLSEEGLRRFGKNIDGLTGIRDRQDDGDSLLTAVFDPSVAADNLVVTLSIVSNEGKRREYERRYTVGMVPVDMSRDLLLWPNFISVRWTRYYLYSDISISDPHSGYTVEPFSLEEEDGPTAEMEIIAGNNKKGNISAYNYEIFQSSVPFKGVWLRATGEKPGGCMTIRYASPQSGYKTLPSDMRGYLRLDPVTLGLDFGSTNTSLSYSLPNSLPSGFDFVNQRISLLGRDEARDKKDEVENPNRVLFFPGEKTSTPSNAIRSILTLHPQRKEGRQMADSTEVEGGFPCFADALPVENVSEGKITLNFQEAGIIEQIQNMKWESGNAEIAHRTAFLKTLLLQTYARLFVMGLVPTALRWSFPSSMGIGLLNKYRMIFSELGRLQPVLRDEGGFSRRGVPYTLKVSRFVPYIRWRGSDFLGSGEKEQSAISIDSEAPEREVRYAPRSVFGEESDRDISLSEANAVANYMSGVYGREAGNLYLCFDIGGSTTDISALYMLREGLTMIRQNSLRFAAEKVSGAAGCVEGFRQVLETICRRNDIFLPGVTDGKEAYDVATAPYYFNRIVERLDDSALSEFYAMIASDAPQFMWVDMYVTGLLVYYAGQTAARLVDDIRHLVDEEAGPTKEVGAINLIFAGKGSRIMQWLGAVHPSAAKDYYNKLFRAGYECGGKGEIPKWRIHLPQIGESGDIKYEVSKGLVRDDSGLCNPEDNTPVEIVGEEGFIIENGSGTESDLRAVSTLTPTMMERVGGSFRTRPDYRGARFYQFCNIFFQTAESLFDVNVPRKKIVEGIENLRPMDFVRSLPEYEEALRDMEENNDKFDFVAPILLLEGMEFYAQTLIPLLLESSRKKEEGDTSSDKVKDSVCVEPADEKSEEERKRIKEEERKRIEEEENRRREEEENKRKEEEERKRREEEERRKKEEEERKKKEEEERKRREEEEKNKLIPVTIDVKTLEKRSGFFGKKTIEGLTITLSSPGNPEMKWHSVVCVQEGLLTTTINEENIVARFEPGTRFPQTISVPLPLPQCPNASRLRIYFKAHPDEPVGINNAYATKVCAISVK